MRIPACYRYPAIEFTCPACSARPGIQCYVSLHVEDDDFRGTHRARSVVAHHYGEDLFRKQERAT